MAKRSEDNEISYFNIPENFIDSNTVMGGTIKLRNLIEASILSGILGYILFSTRLSLDIKIILACILIIPAFILGIIGINGECLTLFIKHYILFLKKKRIVSIPSEEYLASREKILQKKRIERDKKASIIEQHKDVLMNKYNNLDSLNSSIDFQSMSIYEIKQEIKKEEHRKKYETSIKTKMLKDGQDPVTVAQLHVDLPEINETSISYRLKNNILTKKFYAAQKARAKWETEYINDEFELPSPITTVSDFLPFHKIEKGIIYTKDHRFVKFIEVLPVNFMLRSPKEQRNIISSFISYLKISPVKLQFKVISKKSDVNKYLDNIEKEIESENNVKCIELQKDYIKLLKEISAKEATTRRFFLIFEYEPANGAINSNEQEAISFLHTAANTATSYLEKCGNKVISYDNDNDFMVETLYVMLNRKTHLKTPFKERIVDVFGKYMSIVGKDSLKSIPINEFISPKSIDFNNSKYTVIDDTYYSYYFIPSTGYRNTVTAGWLSLLINAGEGIDIDLFFTKFRKETMQQKVGQQIRINRSKIKDTSDTNSDYDSLSDAIKSGYYLKNGMNNNNEDFYYMNILITVSAENLKTLEWKCKELEKLAISKDLKIHSCKYVQEEAFITSLPIAKFSNEIYNRSKRNILTISAASCYPFISYEISDEDGILLGINKYNYSLIIQNIFNAKLYKNANIAMLGTSGSGKTFTLQLMATRMRRKNIQTFIIAPLKGYEFSRACSEIGGEFIQISPGSDNCINVMEIRKKDRTANILIDGYGINNSELATKIQQLHIFFSLLIEDLTNEEKQLLDDALIKVYKEKGITHDNNSLIDPHNSKNYCKMPILEDLYNILNFNEGTKRIALILKRLVHGSASSFNQHTNVNLDNKYIVLDISLLTGDLLSVGMFVVLDYVWDKVKEDRTIEKAVFLDELWHLISKNRYSAEFVLEIFKIIRSYGGSAVCSTQDINDFYVLDDGKYGKGIINNCKTKIILNLEEEEAERVKDTLNLSEAEIESITHFERGNALISTNQNTVMVDLKASMLELELITTDRDDLKKILAQKKTAMKG